MQTIFFPFLWENTLYRALVIGLLGLMVGSFLNVVIYRLPRMLDAAWRRDSADYLGVPLDLGPTPNLLWPPSHCLQCKKRVAPWYNIPLLGFILLRGCCAACGSRISLHYPLVEALTAFLFAVVAWFISAPVALMGGLLFTAMLMALAFIDIDTLLLPDVLTQPLLWAGLMFHIISVNVTLTDAVLGAVIGYLLLWSLYWIFRLFTGKHGMGHGDFKLLAALGAWLGWQMLPFIVFVSSLIGVAVGLVMILGFKRQRGHAFPFGPYLALAGWLAFIRGEAIMNWYLYGL